MAKKAQQVGFHEGTENDVTGQIDEVERRAIEQAAERDTESMLADDRRMEAEAHASTVLNGGAPTPLNDATTEAKKPKKTPEEKREDFKRLASGRVSRAIDALSSLLHLANTSTYEWYTSDREKIFSTLREKIDTVEASFFAAETPAEGKKKTSKQLSFRV